MMMKKNNQWRRWIVLAFLSCQTLISQNYDLSKYPWIHPELNAIQFFDKEAMSHFYSKWHSQEKTKVSIVWMGDSHIQPDVVTETVRKKLQKQFGDSGRGMMFPLSTGRTYSSLQYSSSHVGPWACSRSIEAYPKFTLGVSGATCRVAQPNSSFTLTFQQPVPEHYNLLKIFCKKSPSSFDFLIYEGSNSQLVKVMDYDSTETSYIRIKIPPIRKSISLKVVKNKPEQKEFEFYGMSLESENPGVILHACGIGGAQMSAPLYQKKFTEHLPELEPDLVILDYGGNDYYYYDFIRPDLEADIIKIITQIRTVAPNTSILLTTTQDLMKRGMSVKSGEKYRDLIRKVAKEQKCGFYDWYYISGGTYAMAKWVKSRLAQPDYIHLNIFGYQLKGQMIYHAMVKTAEAYENGLDSLVYSLVGYEKLKPNIPTYTSKSPVNGGKSNSTAGKTVIYHKVVKNETLSHIALKYKVKVSQIMLWNNMKSTLIRVGQKLVIYK